MDQLPAVRQLRALPRSSLVSHKSAAWPQDEVVGSFAEGEETLPDYDRIGSFAETDAQAS